MLERVWRIGKLLTLLVGMQTSTAAMENIVVWRFLKKLEIELPYDPAIPLLGIHTEETRIETYLTSGSTTKPQSSRQYGTGTKTEI